MLLFAVSHPKSLKVAIGLAIVAFWAVMTGWLVRANWNEGNAPFSDLPPILVLRQGLKHEAVSQLGIFRGRQRVGSVTITPVNLPSNSVSLDGNMAIPQEGARPETYNFSIRIDLSATLARVEAATVRLRRKNPPLAALIEILLREQKIRYDIQNGALDLGSQEMPIAAGGLANFVPALAGLPPLPMSPESFLQSMECRANRANFKIRGEQMDGFRVVFSAAGITATTTLGQLGEIFAVRTSTEYQLLADGLEPEKYLP